MIDNGYSTEDLASNSEALEFIAETKKEQKAMEKKIASAIKGELKVQWNLTVAANIISADVQYGDLDAIAAVDGVKQVIVETKYEPYSPVVSDDPDMVISTQEMTGAQAAWAEGQTGAGGRIAIIDTGLDIDHQSFNEDAYLYALEEDAKEAGYRNTARYISSLDLLDTEEIESVLELLNCYANTDGELTAEDLYISAKIPFGFNYVDNNLNVRHIYDSQGEHGSHVAGIAAANRYLETEDGEFVDALSTVYCAGNAPDAQVMVMKVFGQDGGAYDSDYMAAIEDAILLGADSVNLSLGSTAAGFTYSTSYQEIMDKLTETDTVVVISAGNAGQWAENTYNGVLYEDDVNYNTAGSPGSYTNALTVASVNNYGSVGLGFGVAGTDYSYTESAVYGNTELAGLAGDEDSAVYEYVFIDGIGAEEDYEGIDVTGKIVFVSRGTTSFYQKANIAVEKGAIATIVYNNVSGAIGLNLTGYEYTAPCVSILLSDAVAICAASEAQETEDGVVYYTGEITIYGTIQPIVSTAENYTMSSFSSFGVPGDLSLKPEITAPGGSIWSVNGTNNAGGGTDQYELMSGTSMAAPQVTGMITVLKRYLETAVGKKLPDISNRALAQSLLMSTATPLVDEDGNLYPVFQQGAGLANVDDAINAASYIIMGDSATASASDGKVKAELGDDPDKTGVYTFDFTITNMTWQKHSYTLNEAIFTQLVSDGVLWESTDLLDADVTYYVNGTNVSEEPVNPYEAEVAEAQAAYDEAVSAYNEAVDAVAAAREAANTANAALVSASAELAAARARLQAVEACSRVVKNVMRFTPWRCSTASQDEVNAAKAEVTAAEKAYNEAYDAVCTMNRNVRTALNDETMAYYECRRAEAALRSAKCRMNSWRAPYEVDTVTLDRFASAEVTVVITLTDEQKAALDENYVNGAYVEGYICLDSKDDTSSHSIPVLAYYGNWSDASMFDKGSYVEYAYGYENRAPYLYSENSIYGNTFSVTFADDGKEYYFGGNLFASENTYSPLRNALNNENGDYIANVYYTLIRNAAARAVIISDYETGEIYAGAVLGSQYAAYYNSNSSSWANTNNKIGLNWAGTDAEGNALSEGTTVILSLIAVTEYNMTEDGDIDFASLGNGAYFSTMLTIDNTAPEIQLVTSYSDYFGTESEDGTDGLIVKAVDNEYIAAIELYADDGEELIGRASVGRNGIYTILANNLDPDIYLIRVTDYAGNSSTYRIFLNVEPTTEVESITLSDDALTLVKNNTASLTAKVNPNTLYDRSVIWTSSDETVATVDADGTVTAVGVGECTITAAAVADTTYTAVCDVTVIEINVDLNGVVWDENGEVWFAEINTTSLPDYTVLTSVSTDYAINGLAYGADGTLYASTIDTSDGYSSLYTVDTDTYELTYVGDSSIFYADMAEAPHLTGLIGVYGSYVVLIDPTTGEYAGAFNYASGQTLVGITYIGSMLNTYYGEYLDMYYILDADGNAYMEAFICLNGKYYYFNGSSAALIENTGITCDTAYFQSIYYNGEYTFVSSFNKKTNNVALYAVDLDYTGEVFFLGYFEDGVWPVAALSEFSVSDTDEEDEDGTDGFASALVTAEAVTDIEK